MKNLSNLIRSRSARFVSLRVALVLGAAMVVAGFGVASAWSGGIGWLSLRTASAERNAPSANAANAPRALMAPGVCDAAIPGNVEVEGSGGTAPAQPFAYPTLTAAFAAINGGGHTGALVTIDICADTTETASAVLNASGVGLASYSAITMSPVGLRTISGSVAGPLIDLNGADFVTINGLGSLTIENTLSAATPSTIRFIADATNNTIQNCTVKGAGTSATLGTIFFSTGAAAGTGNDGNMITGNTITSSGANFPTNGIYSLGTSAAIDNSGNTVSMNNITDYFNATLVTNGILLGITGNSGWTITGNKLFQNSTRIYTTSNTHNGIFIGAGSGYTVNDNVIGFSNAMGTGTTNIVGNSVALTGTFPSSYTTTGTANATRYIAINAAFTAGGAPSDIQNNTIGGFALYTSSGATTTNGIWCGINVASGNANIGTTTGNTIGATSGLGSVYTAATTTGGTAVGIYATSTNTVSIQNNTIGAIDAMGTSATIAGSFTGIDSAGAGGLFTINNNTIGSATANNIRIGYSTTTGVSGGPLSNAGLLVTTTVATTGILRGILNSATGATLNVTNNTIRNMISSVAQTGASSAILAIQTSGAVPTTVNITGNKWGTSTDKAVTFTAATTGQVNGLLCTGGAAGTTVNLNTNIIQGIVSLISTGQVVAVSNQGAAGVAINIKDNQAGTVDNDFVTYSGASAGTILGYFNAAGASTALLTITGNDIRRIVQNVAGSSNHSYISNQTFTGSTNISTNTFTNITANTTGTSTVTFIGNSVTHAAGTTHNVNNNMVVTGYTKTGGSGQITYYNSFGSSPSTVTEINTGNNFSNMNFTGTTGGNIGWRSADGTTPGSRKTVTGNTFSNITGGSGAMTSILYVGFSDNTFAGNNVSGNMITNITNGGSISAIFSDGQNQNFVGNIITGLSSSGSAAVVNGIELTGATTQNVTKNKIGNLSASGSGASVNGILASSGATFSISNNLIGDLRATGASATNPLIGLNIGAVTTANIFFNTVYLNGTSTGTNFGSSAASISTTPTVTLTDNILVNTSTPRGTGLTVAHRRSGISLTNYATASNNNDLFAGPPATNRLIFNDGTNSDQILSAYKTRVSTRDSASISANPNFLSTAARPTTPDSPMDANFLHINPAIGTLLESGGIPAGGIGDDYDGEARNGTTPDIGADEFAGAASLANDIASSGIVVPLDGSSFIVGASSTPQAGFNNAGNTTQGPINVQFTITGPGGYSYTDSQVIASLAPSASTTVTFAAAPSFTTQGLYTMSAAVTTADSNAANDVVNGSFTVLAPLSGSYNVPGDYASLTNAGGVFDNMNSLGATGNVTININGNLTGETGAFSLSPVAGGFTVTIKPTAGGPRSISGTSAGCLVGLNGADNVTIDGSNNGTSSRDLTITNTNASTSSAVVCLQSNGADGATNNVVKNLNVIGNSNTTTLFGVFSGSSTISISSTGAGNNSNTIQNNNISKTQYGIYSGGTSAAAKNTGNMITQNLINAVSPNNVAIGGILVNFESGIQITLNNIAHISSATTPAFGITLGARPSNSFTTFTGSEVAGALVSRNTIDDIFRNGDGTSIGIGVATVTVAGSAVNTISNNMISRVRTAATPSDFAVGILVGGGTVGSTAVYFNSVSMTGSGATTGPTFGIVVGGTNPTVDLRDNIFANTQTTTGGKTYAIGLTYGTPYTNLTSDYNDFYSTGATANFAVTGGLTGVDRISLGAWKTETGKDANSPTPSDPSFLSTSDLHLPAGSSVLGLGLSLGSVTVDVDNDPRPASMPDIGADEVVQSVGGVIPTGTFYNASFVNGDSLSGNVTITNSLTLSGITTTGANTLTIDCNASISGASAGNYVIGNMTKNYCVGQPFNFPVGTANGYSPLDTDVTAVFSPGSSLTVRVDEGTAPATPALNPATTLQRFWTLTEGGAIQANLLFHYLDLGGGVDVNGNESTYQLTRIEGMDAVRIPAPQAPINTTLNTMSINNVQNFSKWTATEPLAPTSVEANVAGHVVDNTGAPLAGVTMTLLDTVLVQNRTTLTDSNGYYFFDAILTGRQIVVTPSKTGYSFSPANRAFNHIGDLTSVDFTGTRDSSQHSVGSDFDGDGKADLSVFRPSEATWYTLLSSTGTVKVQQWGLGTDRIVPADYDGDHITDIAVFRPSTGTWYINQSSTSTLRTVNWGLADDIVTPADFDGDGLADIAVFRPSTGTWYIIDSHNGLTRTIQWGLNGDRPVAADYDGDGKADIAVWRPSDGIWYVMKEDGGYTHEHWGIEEDRVVVGDYDGDNKADLAVFRPSTATWYVKLSSDGSINTRAHGTASDVLAPADYDGDGKTDRAVWQAGGDWNILRSTTDTPFGQKWGTTGDIPTTSAYVR